MFKVSLEVLLGGLCGAVLDEEYTYEPSGTDIMLVATGTPITTVGVGLINNMQPIPPFQRLIGKSPE